MADIIEFPNPWAIAGLYRLDDLPERQPLTTWNTGFLEWNGKVALAPGTLSVVTGLPGSGKTILWAQIWHYVVAKYDLVALIASFECPPKPHYRRYLREFFSSTSERDMLPQQIEQADQFIADHYRFLVHPEEAPTLDWLLEMAAVAVRREGARIIQIDPWNRLESQRGPKETEPEYVAKVLRALGVFAKETNTHVQIVAHPAKREFRSRDKVPEMEDVAGAMHWWNMPDQGFVVHREEIWNEKTGRCYDAELHYRKARFEELGYPCCLHLRFNPMNRRFGAVNRP